MIDPPLHDRALRVSQRVVRGMRTHRAFEAAAAVAFWFFLSLVPLLVLAGYLVGQVARARGVDALVDPLLDVAPGAAEEIVRKEVMRLAGAKSATLAPLVVAGYLWTASSGLHNLMDVFETTAGAARRAWWKKRAIALGWVVLGLATICALAWLLVRADTAVHDLRETVHRGAARVHVRGHVRRTPNEQALIATVMLVVGTTFLAGFYRLAIATKTRAHPPVWPGTVAAVIGWLVVSWAFGAYAVSIADYAAYYGGLAAVAVLLVWLYLTSLALVFGAEINAQLAPGVLGGRRR